MLRSSGLSPPTGNSDSSTRLFNELPNDVALRKEDGVPLSLTTRRGNGLISLSPTGEVFVLPKSIGATFPIGDGVFLFDCVGAGAASLSSAFVAALNLSMWKGISSSELSFNEYVRV